MMFRMFNGGGLRITGATLRDLISNAYEIRDFQLSGGPGWVNTERYDLLAKPDASSDEGLADFRKMTEDQRRGARVLFRRRLQLLLTGRFQVVVRRETRERPVYALVVAKGGVKMPEAKESDGMNMSNGSKGMNCKACPIEPVAATLASIVGRPVKEETGLKGKYDFKLEWAPDTKPAGAERPEVSAAEAASTPEGPTLFTALQQTL